MDAAVLERAYEAFQEFHGYFAPVRKEARENSSHYLQALLVQSDCRRRFRRRHERYRILAESPWDDDAVIDRLQEYLSSRLKDSQGVWVLDGSDFPKQGMKSVGVARHLRGVGEDSQLPSRGVSGPRGGQGTGAGGQEAVSAGGMDWGRALCDGGSAGGPTGVPKQD